MSIAIRVKDTSNVEVIRSRDASQLFALPPLAARREECFSQC
ncbi:MAG TPA: hypothetical protein V6D09_15365 [Leptolyngbyaceae cyanobacterium]